MFGTILKSALAVGVTAIAATIGVTGAHDGYTTIRRKLGSFSKKETSPRKKAKKKAVTVSARRRSAARRHPAVKAPPGYVKVTNVRARRAATP